MVFGRGKAAASTRIASDFGGAEVTSALRGNWLTLALAQYDRTVTSRYERSHSDAAVARGVVHFDVGFDCVIPAQVTLLEDEPRERGRVGRAHFTSFRPLGNDPGHILLSVDLADRGGRITNELQAAFDSAALSQHRFVHISFRREPIEDAGLIDGLKKDGYGAYHDLTEYQFVRKSHLAAAPAWASSWNKNL